jgi:hypothetical protein
MTLYEEVRALLLNFEHKCDISQIDRLARIIGDCCCGDKRDTMSAAPADIERDAERLRDIGCAQTSEGENSADELMPWRRLARYTSGQREALAIRLVLAEAVATAACVFLNRPPRADAKERDEMLDTARDAAIAWTSALPDGHPAKLEHGARLKMSTAELAGLVRSE